MMVYKPTYNWGAPSCSLVGNNEMEMKQQDPFHGEWVEKPISQNHVINGDHIMPNRL